MPKIRILGHIFYRSAQLVKDHLSTFDILFRFDDAIQNVMNVPLSYFSEFVISLRSLNCCNFAAE